MATNNYGSPVNPPRWGSDGRKGAGEDVYFPPAPFPSMGTSAFCNKVLGTIRVGDAATHPQTIQTGAGFPDVFRFSDPSRRV
jgi:hypothetical protein